MGKLLSFTDHIRKQESLADYTTKKGQHIAHCFNRLIYLEFKRQEALERVNEYKRKTKD